MSQYLAIFQYPSSTTLPTFQTPAGHNKASSKFHAQGSRFGKFNTKAITEVAMLLANGAKLYALYALCRKGNISERLV